jgi:uncharacterized membrane protein
MGKKRNPLAKSNNGPMAKSPPRPQNEGEASRHTLVRTASHYSGPLPPPELLADYDAIVPGAAEAIINTMMRQTEHRMSLERIVIEGDSRRAYLGLGSAFTVAMTVIYLSYQLAMQGHGEASAVVLVADLAALVSVFVYGTSSRKQERLEKAKQAEE